MRRGTSLYLDLVRFAAALAVFTEHLREHTKNGFGAFWRAHPFAYGHLNPYSQIAVTVFFVLSGYVIAHVLATRERDPLDYATSRLARLYSVVIPALVLTSACNWLITLRYPDAFEVFTAGGPLSVVGSYLGTALFVSRYWLWPDLEPPNAPMWSLSFEATYYVAIALLVFARGRGRVLGLIGLFLLAGPTMVLLAPTWLIGYVAYHVSPRLKLRPSLGLVLWAVSLALLPLCAELELGFRTRLPFLRTTDHAIGVILTAYAAASCFAVNVVALDAFADRVAAMLSPFAAAIRWLGSLTFALYLFHQPLLSLFTVYHVPDRSSAMQLVLLVGSTFLVVATVGRFCESTKDIYKRWFLSAASVLTRPSSLAEAQRTGAGRPP